MSNPSSYGKVYAFGHRATKVLLNGAVCIQEKIDGSQISFRAGDDDKLYVRSRKTEIDLDQPDSLFGKAVAHIKLLHKNHLLQTGITYRGEAVTSPRHNTLTYERTPHGCIVLFDVDQGDQTLSLHEQVRCEADRLGLTVVPQFWTDTKLPEDPKIFEALIKGLLMRDSILGGKLEGIVIKPSVDRTDVFDPTSSKVIMAKIVRDEFKELHNKEWKGKHPTAKGFIVEDIGEALGTPARYEKAVQHLQEDGRLTGTEKDIRELFKEVQEDLKEEVIDYIKERLYKHFERPIFKAATRNIPNWYKGKLLEDAVAETNDTPEEKGDE